MCVLGTAIAAASGSLSRTRPPRAAALARRRRRRAPRARRAALAAAVAWTARGLSNLGRTLPELVWALLVIFAVGLGPFAGALALGIHTAGVLGRLYAEALEEVPTAPVAALRAAGAGDAGGVRSSRCSRRRSRSSWRTRSTAGR